MAKVGTLIFTVDTTDATNTTYDATISGFGDVTGFFAYNFGKDLDSGTEYSDDRMDFSCVGAVKSDGTFQTYSQGVIAYDNLGTTSQRRGFNTSGDADMWIHRAGEYRVTRITDGLRLEKVGTAFKTNDRRFDIVITVFADCKTQTSITVPTTGTGGTTVTTNATDGSGNFDAGLLFSLCSSHGSAGYSGDSLISNLYSIGFAAENGGTYTQFGYLNGGRGNVSTTVQNQYFNNGTTNGMGGQVWNNSTNWSGGVLSWTNNGSTSNFKLRAAGSVGGDQLCILAVENTIKANVGYNAVTNASTSDTLTGTTDSGYYGKVAFFLPITANQKGITETAEPDVSGTAMCFLSENSSGATSGSYGGRWRDNVGTSDTSNWKTTNDLQLKSYNSGYKDEMIATTAFDGNDVDVTYSTVPASGDTIHYGYIVMADDEAPTGGFQAAWAANSTTSVSGIA